MAEWLVEDGIGEERAFRLSNDGIEELRLRWPAQGLLAGMVGDAALLERPGPDGRARVQFASGDQAFARSIPRQASVGAQVRVQVTREAIAERGRLKLAQARHTDAAICDAPSLADQLAVEGHDVRTAATPSPSADWDALWADAAQREVMLAGGSLLLAETPALTLIDVDWWGEDPSAVTGAIVRTLRRFDLGGNIAIDFPTVSTRAERKAIDEQLGIFLQDWPHERTAMNGFGLVQIVRRLERPSLLHRIARDRRGAVARLLLRRAEMLEGAGQIALYAQPSVLDCLRADWLEELRRRGGERLEEGGAALRSTHRTPRSCRYEHEALPDLQNAETIRGIRPLLFRAVPRQGPEPLVQRWLFGARAARRSRRYRPRC